jgi:heavy metal sensor kinase
LKRLTIQARLTAWYLLSIAVIVLLFAGGSWLALKSSMYDSIDRDLRYSLNTVMPFIESHSLSTQEQFARTFSGSLDASVVGGLVQITDENSQLVYESDALRSHNVPVMETAPPDGSIAYDTVGRRSWPMRTARKTVHVRGTTLTVHVVEPLRATLSELGEYTTYLALMIPVVLILTTAAGYWMSRRALAPVEVIRKEAEAIHPTDLAARIPVPASDDELSRLAGTLNDMLERIEQGFRREQQFTADASHELRAPLALIITAGDVSLRRQRSREELTETLGKIVREARRMSHLVEDLLALARGDAQTAKIEMTAVDLGPMLHELCSELQAAARTKGLSLVAALPDERTMVLGEPAELRRLFLILLDNAIKYTEAGTVTISIAPEDGHVKAIVSDTGIGIEADALPHIFDRFWRADKVRSRAAGGAGLGLSLASQIVRNQGGTICAESEPGRGSSFLVELQSGAASDVTTAALRARSE